MNKKIKDMDFDDLATWVRNDLFNALMEDGTNGMKRRFYITYNVIIQWQEAMEKRREKEKK